METAPVDVPSYSLFLLYSLCYHFSNVKPFRMFHLTLIAIDRLKEPFWRAAFDEYAQRLAPYAKLEVIEVAAEKFSANDDPAAVRAREGERLRKAVAASKARTVVCLAEEGKTFTSPAFASWLRTQEVHGTIAFVIGGALGLDPALKAEADLLLSLSPLTFLHEMARVVLVEQLYRAGTINTGKRYHY